MNASIASLERRDGLAHNLRRMVKETENFLQAAAQTGDEKFMTIRGQLAEQVRNMRWQLDELEDNAVHKARHAARVADQTIHGHPYGAIGIAVAVGLLVGFLAARR
jgi:ElaB/YqjD/DUF883 family membrane-anchored ribosome-binding protein